MSKVGGSRNFGWGKSMTWAGKAALREMFGNGRFGTVAEHGARWRRFCDWAKGVGIRDARDIRQADLAQYAARLGERTEAGMSPAYAKNLITSANVTLQALRGDKSVWARPGEYVGPRSVVRRECPATLDRRLFERAVAKLESSGKARVAAVALLSREFGLRRKEASLLQLRLAHTQAKHLGKINVTEGTKGGRGKAVDRWVPAGATAVAVLERAINAARGADNLIPVGKTYGQWATAVSKGWQSAAKANQLGPLRDLRSAYACERYRSLTLSDAPVVAGSRVVDRGVDKNARATIAQELGHGRTDVVAAYVGSGR